MWPSCASWKRNSDALTALAVPGRVSVVEPVSLIVAALVAALAPRAADRALDATVDVGEGVLRRLVDRVRQRFADEGDVEASRVLDLVEQVPDSQLLIEQLATAIDRHATNAPAFVHG